VSLSTLKKRRRRRRRKEEEEEEEKCYMLYTNLQLAQARGGGSV